jgi:hypothetical protein
MKVKCVVIVIAVAAGLLTACTKKESSANAPTPAVTSETSANAHSPAPVPAIPLTIAPPANGDVDATLAQLTRELHRSMIGAKKLPASFEEFAASRRLDVPPPPAGKKYAISKQWRVVLTEAR